MDGKSTFDLLKAEAERHSALNNQLRLDFIAAELNTTMTFISLARTALRMEHFESCRRLQAKAAQACAEAQKQIREAEARGSNVARLRRHLYQACAALEKLPSS